MGGGVSERERERARSSTTFLWTTISFYSWKITVWIHYATVLLIFFITCPRHYQVPWHTMYLSLSLGLSLHLYLSLPPLSLSLFPPLSVRPTLYTLSVAFAYLCLSLFIFPLPLCTPSLSVSPLPSPLHLIVSLCLSLTPSVALASLRYNVIGDAWMQ